MPTPQSGVLPDANTDALFLTLAVRSAAGETKNLGNRIAAIPSLVAALSKSVPEAGLHAVVAVGADCWDMAFPGTRPSALRSFQQFADGGRVAPATSADIFLHIRSERRDVNFDMARTLLQALGSGVSVIEEIPGFRYRDSRDMIGFVDGTENPQGDDRAAVALVGEEEREFAGGSYISIQRYVHDLAHWEEVPVADQEKIIGRTKADNIEFKSEDKAPTAHIKRVSIKEDGKSLEILRHSMPYGSVSEHGLYFVAYCSTPDNFDRMLERMIVVDANGDFDHLLRFSRAVTGASFFAPSLEFLRRYEA